MNNELKKMLKFRLPKYKNKEYVDWMFKNKLQGTEVHHILGKKYNDFFLVTISPKQHSKIHTFGYSEGEFEDLFSEALRNLFKYIMICQLTK